MQRRLEQIDESITRYLSQLDSADRQGPTVPEAKITRLNEKIATLRDEIQRLNALNAQMIQTEGTSRSPLRIPMHARWPRAAGAAGSSVTIMQSAVDTKHHLIVSHEVTNVGTDRGQLSSMAEQARTAIGSETIEVVADRGYYAGEEILACEEAGITVYLPKPMTSGAKAKGRFGKQDFVYVAEDDIYLSPAGERLWAACSRHWRSCAPNSAGRASSAIPLRPPARSRGRRRRPRARVPSQASAV
jgi:hypothetical protein